MVRKLAYLLVILAVLTAVGELCGLLLPTLSWPFTVSREMSMLNIVCTDQNNGGLLTPQGKFLWFGWVCVLVMGGLGFWLMLRAFGAIGLGSDMGAMQIAGSGWTIFSGILLLLCSLWILFQPLVFGTTAVIVWVGISLLFAGVAACSLSLQLHRAHRCLGDR